MDNKLLNPLAIDCNGNFVRIENAQKGQEYFCPKCNEPLTFRKQGTGPHAHRNHFSHRVNTDCHGLSESEIHRSAKEGIFKILHDAIENKQDFYITWKCPECGETFRGNLLQWAKSVEMEKNLKDAQPDVALLDERGKVLIAIEVVFTHEVEKPTWDFYLENNIVVVRIIVRTMEDSKCIGQKLSNPDDVNLCYTVSCPKYQDLQVLRKVIPLYKKDCEEKTINNISAFAVALLNPFEKQINLSGYFTEKDKTKALQYAKIVWPNHHQFKFVQGSKYTYMVPDVPKPVQPRLPIKPYRHNPFQLTPLERAQKKASRNAAIRASYARKAGGGKKTGGRRK